MLNPLDDFPVHQTPEPLASPATSDRNAYDRYFFNGYSADGSIYFAAALGVYPNRHVMDAAFSVVTNGVQTSVHASRRLPLVRTDTAAGPVSVGVEVPLQRLTVRVGPNDSGVEADLTFTARSVAIEEPRFTHRRGTQVVMDYTRLTQFGSWSGTLTLDGERHAIGGGEVLGSRDRSWGVRGVGERDQSGAPTGAPQFFWLWAPLNFGDRCAHFDVNEDDAGHRWHANGMVVPVVDGEAAGDVSGRSVEVLAPVDHSLTWRPGTRRATAATITLGEERIELEPLLDFQMLGIGYLHPEWGHGMWKGEEAVGVERWALADLDPLLPWHLHVQALCRARWGDREGVGVLEQLAIGPHAPSGFTDLLDGAR